VEGSRPSNERTRLEGSLSPEYTVNATAVTAAATTSSCVLGGGQIPEFAKRVERDARALLPMGADSGFFGGRAGIARLRIALRSRGRARDTERHRQTLTSPEASASGSVSYARRRTAAPWTEACHAMSDVPTWRAPSSV